MSAILPKIPHVFIKDIERPGHNGGHFATLYQLCNNNGTITNMPLVSEHINSRSTYRKISNIRRTKSQTSNDPHLVLKSSLPNPLKGGVNTLRQRQNSRLFPDDIFKWIFVNENIWISLRISLKFVPRVRIDNIKALVQIMAWCRPGDKPLSEPMMVKFTDAYMRHSASMS